jgi:NADH-quinone oxidoreductase subunit L
MVAWLIALTVFLPWLGAVCVWAVGNRRPGLQHGLASLFAISAGLASLALLPNATSEVALTIPVGGVFGDFTFVPDAFAVSLASIATVVGSLAVVFSIDYMKGNRELGRYYAMVLLFIGAMAGLVLSGSLLLMFFFWEITAFCSYTLISFYNDDPKAVSGGIKALIVTQVGGVGLLAGALISYAYLGSYQLSTFLAESSTLPAAVLSLVAFGYLVAAAAKSAQVPLHTWLPDAMEAPTPVTALIHAATMVNAGVYLLARFYPAFALVPGWTNAVITVGLLSALLAAWMAITAVDLKRALAYSTISQLGYMVYAVGVGAVFASQFHLLSHAVFKGLLFLGAGAVIHAVGTRDMRQMGGLGKSLPLIRAAFVIGALALAGIPIANGFFSKELVLEGGLSHGPSWAFVGMLVGVGLTAIYTIRMVWMVFYGSSGPASAKHGPGSAMSISLGVLAAGTLVSWLVAGPFSQTFARTAPFHEVHATTTWEIVNEILTTPTTWLAILVVGLGVALWLFRERLAGIIRSLQPLERFAKDDLGFERLNGQLVRSIQGFSTALSHTQTGQLNWNVAGIVGGLVVLLAILAWSVR